jgi:hypothetical protein
MMNKEGEEDVGLIFPTKKKREAYPDVFSWIF